MGIGSSKTLEEVLLRALTDRRSRFSRLDALMWQNILVPYVVGPSFLADRQYRYVKLWKITQENYHFTESDEILVPEETRCLIVGHNEKSLCINYPTEYHHIFYDSQVIFRWQDGSSGEYLVNWRDDEATAVPDYYQYQDGYFSSPLSEKSFSLALRVLPAVDLLTLPRGRIYVNKYPQLIPMNLRSKITRPNQYWPGEWNNKLMVTPEGNILIIDTAEDDTLVKLYSSTGQLILSRQYSWELMFVSPTGRLYFKRKGHILVNIA